MRALGTRLLQLVPIMILVSLASFVLIDLLPGDPAIAILGENATPETGPVCPRRTCRSRPVFTSQSRAVWSRLPVARVRPSGEKAMDRMPSACPRSTLSSRPVCASQRQAVPSRLPVARILPSGE